MSQAAAPTVETPTEAVTYAAYARPLWQRLLLTRTAAMVGLLVLAYAYAYNRVEFFDGKLTNYFLLMDMAPILLMALPMTLIIITGEIDLSVASILGLSAVVSGLMIHDHHWSVPAAGALALVVGLLAGALNGFLVAYVGLPSLAVTIGTLALYRGVAVGLIGTKAVSGLPQDWRDLANKHIGTSSYPLIVIPIVVLAVVFAVLLHFTPFGRGRLRDRPQRRDRSLQRCRRTPEQAAALHLQRGRLGVRRGLLPAALRQRQHRHRHRPGASGDRGGAARRRVHLRWARATCSVCWPESS